MPFGKYQGIEVKSIPNSYLRWLMNHDGIPQFLKEEARKKLEKSDYDNTDIEVTRHAVDMFSKRFLDKWDDKNTGIGSFVAQRAIEAFTKGKVLAGERTFNHGIKFLFDDIIWVINWDKKLPQYKSLITVMKPNKSEVNT